MNEPNYAGCGSAACIHEETLNDAYHTITGLMTTYLEHKYGKTAYDDWKIKAALASEQSEREDCKFSELTIYNLIQHFGILREDFERIYTNTSDYYGIEYNVDLLYSGDKKAIEAYYSAEINEERVNEIYFKMDVSSVKLSLLSQSYSIF
ncbi:hypothetical protein FACS1894219_09850 [Clostridia bacterium]|nr:hypothetical protein FACS1894219_09850 [Clostridia bacterium]